MPTSQNTAPSGAAPALARPHVPTPAEFYHSLMGSIEPDLLLSTAEREQKYADEAPQEKQQRMQRYEKAFLSYKQQRTEAYAKLHASVDTYVRGIRALAEAESQKSDERMLHDIEVQVSLLAV